MQKIEFKKGKQNHTSHFALHTSQKGITLIALIITIIVMLILVGVTITVALNGGLFSKGEEATTKTKITQIQEALTIKRGEVLADYKGKAPEDYGIELKDLNLPEELKTEYGNKLIISKDGKLYYDASTVTNAEEQNQFKTMGIEEYVETNTGTLANSYTFTLAEIASMEGVTLIGDGYISITSASFWPEDVSEELKDSIITKTIDGTEYETYNIICSNPSFINGFEQEGWSGDPNTFLLMTQENNIIFMILDEISEPINNTNYANYANLTFTITMAE